MCDSVIQTFSKGHVGETCPCFLNISLSATSLGPHENKLIKGVWPDSDNSSNKGFIGIRQHRTGCN